MNWKINLLYIMETSNHNLKSLHVYIYMYVYQKVTVILAQ